MSALDRAMELLNMSPLPDDVEAQLTALENEASDDEKPLFADLWEALLVAQDA